MQEDRKAKRALPFSWWKLVAGLVLVVASILFLFLYSNNERNMFFAVVFIFTGAPGVLLAYLSFKSRESGFSFYNRDGKRTHTGKENVIMICAKRDTVTLRDVPLILKFVHLTHIPRGARPHYVRNLKRHLYEIYNNNETKKLDPVGLPDKKSFPPELFQIPAAMQPYKDAIDYTPPTMLQKVAPGVLLGAIGVVGLLMVMTGG